jgi:hypothetical protein
MKGFRGTAGYRQRRRRLHWTKTIGSGPVSTLKPTTLVVLMKEGFGRQESRKMNLSIGRL